MERGQEPIPGPAGDPGQIRGKAGRYLTAGGLPHHRAIVALDIEQSTRRPDPVKAELRRTMYDLFDAALLSAGIERRHRDRFVDRGDGVLALIHPVHQAPKAILLNQAIPALSRLLADYNNALPCASRAQRLLRVRAVVHAGEVNYDANGCFGEALDVAFRLLDAARVKRALRAADDPLILVVSGDIYRSVVRHGYDGIDQDAFQPMVRVQVAGHRHCGWIQVPAQSAPRPVAELATYRAAAGHLRRVSVAP
jgi:class 3 adenylate cyclase